MKTSMTVLVVDDDRAITLLLQRLLEEDGFAVDTASTGETGRATAAAKTYDGMVLDLALPDIHGIALIEDLRRSGRDLPILVLTSTKDEQTTVRALDAGADDYVTKPIDAAEFKARMRALVRRGSGSRSDSLALANVRLNRVTRQVLVSGQPLALTPREYSLLEHFIARAGELVSRGELQEDTLVTPPHADPNNLLDVNVGRLRRKLAAAGAQVSLIVRRRQGFIMAPLIRS